METLLLPAQINKDVTSRMFANLPADQLKNIQNDNTTAHFHSYSVSKSKTQASDDYNSLLNVVAFATNPGNSDDQFVNIVEGKKSKIYGTQFHPEKMLNSFYKKTTDNPNGVLDDKKGGVFFNEGTAISTTFAKFIVSEAAAGVCPSDATFKAISPIPDIVPILNNEINKIQKKVTLNQENNNGVAIKSCGRFSYSWYRKANADPTTFAFSCSASSGQARKK